MTLLLLCGGVGAAPSPSPAKQTKQAKQAKQTKDRQTKGRQTKGRQTKGRQTNPRPSLAGTVATRLRAALGVPVKLGAIGFSLFDGTITLRRLRLGAQRAPLLWLARADAKPALGAGGQHLARLTVRGFRARLSSRQLASPLPRARGYGSAAVDALSATGGTVRIASGKGRLVLSGLSVVGRALKVAFVKGGTRLRGQLSLRAKALKLGTLVLRELNVELDAGAGALTIRSLSARLWKGTVVAKGKLGLGRGRLGRLRLVGSYRGAGATASFVLSGRPGHAMKLSGRVRATPQRRLPLLSPKGGVARSPRLRLDLRWGRQRIRGRLDHWQVR